MSKLPNAPLQEVIFEIRWDLKPGKDAGQMFDENFELASGRLSALIENNFSFYRRIVPQEGFRILIQDAIQWLLLSYKEKISIRFASLRYIDAIKVDEYGGINEGWQTFIKKYFNFEYQNHFDTLGIQKQIQINQTFALADGSDLQLQISDGTKKNEKALVWQTAMLKKSLFETDQLYAWADYAHGIAHVLFKEMIKPELYASFNRKN